jgi:hypothetical protein
MDSNGVLLQLIECIETIKSDVKKKMTCGRAVTHAPKSPGNIAKQFFLLPKQKFLFKERKRRSASDRDR